MKDYSSMNEISNDCILCFKNIKIKDLPIIINKALFSRYNNSNKSNSIINNILKEEKSIYYLNFYENEIYIKEEDFHKRYYLSTEFIFKFENLMKFHQFNIYQPKNYIEDSTKSVFKYFKLKKRIQEKAIKKLLDALSDSELEKMNFNLEEYEKMRSMIIENKEEKTKNILKGISNYVKKFSFEISDHSINYKNIKFFEKKESQSILKSIINKRNSNELPSFIKSDIFEFKKEINVFNDSFDNEFLDKKQLNIENCLPSKFKKKKKVVKKKIKIEKLKLSKINEYNKNNVLNSKTSRKMKNNVFSEDRKFKKIKKINQNKIKNCITSRETTFKKLKKSPNLLRESKINISKVKNLTNRPLLSKRIVDNRKEINSLIKVEKIVNNYVNSPFENKFKNQIHNSLKIKNPKILRKQIISSSLDKKFKQKILLPKKDNLTKIALDKKKSKSIKKKINTKNLNRINEKWIKTSINNIKKVKSKIIFEKVKIIKKKIIK